MFSSPINIRELFDLKVSCRAATGSAVYAATVSLRFCKDVIPAKKTGGEFSINTKHCAIISHL